MHVRLAPGLPKETTICHGAQNMEKKIFWMIFTVLGITADIVLPIWWGLLATIPICYFAWWVAYRSDWF